MLDDHDYVDSVQYMYAICWGIAFAVLWRPLEGSIGIVKQ